MGWCVSIVWRWLLWRHAISWLWTLRRKAIGCLLYWRAVGRFCAKNERGCCCRVEIFVLFKLDIMMTTSSVKHLQRNLTLQLMYSRQSHDSLYTFQDLSLDDSLF